MTINAVIYARVSTDEQAAKGFSLPTQIEACENYAAQNNYEVAAMFQDDFTGTVMDRPGLNGLRKFCSENSIKVVIVYDIDRLARKAVHQMLIEEELEKEGVLFEYVLGQYSDSDEGRLQKQIRASIAEYERGKILERGKRGKFGKAKSGSVIVGARPPYGYSTKKEGKRKWFKINQDEAKVVKLIFQLYVHGDGKNPPLSQNKIATKLTEMKIPTRGDKQHHVAKKMPKYAWRPATIRSILNQEAYTGTWYYGKTIMEKGKQVPRDRSEWVPVSVPQIIDQATFDDAHAIMKTNKEMAMRSTKHNYLMRSRLKCNKCGYSYIGRTRRNIHQYYYCKGAEQVPHKLCNMPTFRADQVNNAVWKWIEELILDPDNLSKGLRDRQQINEERNSHLIQQIDIIDEQIIKNQVKMDKLLDLYLEGSFEKGLIENRQRELEKTIMDLQTERHSISGEIDKDGLTEDQIIELENFVQEVAKGIEVADFETKRRIIDLLDVRGKLAIENNEKVVYVTCKLEKQQRSLALTSRLLNTGVTWTTTCAFRRTVPCP